MFALRGDPFAVAQQSVLCGQDFGTMSRCRCMDNNCQQRPDNQSTELINLSLDVFMPVIARLDRYGDLHML
jgi:hypothetical protein